MKTTANYGLKKPEGTDVVNIEDLNYNADILDQKIKEVDNKASNITVPVTSVNNKTGAVNLTASDLGAETPSAAQAKANTAESNAKAYTDTKIVGVTTQLGDIATHSTYKFNKDSNDIFTEVQHKRADGTLISKSVLSGGTSPKYATRIVTKYASNGTTIEWTKVYTLTYDAYDNLINEVLQ